MGKPRIRGQHTKIFVEDGSHNRILVGEVNKFSAKDLGELKKSRAIGEAGITATKTFEGYDLSFEGGKVDWNLARLNHIQNLSIYSGDRSPYFVVVTKFTYFKSSAVDTYTYPECTFHGYNIDVDANDELGEKWEGFCGEPANRASFNETATDDATISAKITALIEYARGLDTDVT